jgi:hypothetical protein
MTDIKSPTLLYLKGLLFLLLGVLACAAILLWYPHWQLALLLALAIWSFCRAYYFAFYVIQHYIDPQFRYAGLVEFMRYLLTARRKPDA